MSAANLFTEIYASQIDTQGNLLIDSIEKSGQRLKMLVDGLLEFSKIDDLSIVTKSKVNLIKLTKDLTK